MDKLNNRTNHGIYLEYFNDWLTVKAMAEYYNITEQEMTDIIMEGRNDHRRFENTKQLKP